MARRRRAFLEKAAGYQELEARNLLATFAGTAGDDVFIVRFTDGVPTEIEINGVVNANPDATVHLDLIAGFDEISFENVPVDGALTELGDGGIAGSVNDGVVTFDLPSRDSLRLISGVANDRWRIDLNPAFDFLFPVLDTGGGDDVIDSQRGYFFASLGDGDDRVQVHTTDHFAYSVDAGDGFDEFEFVETDARFDIIGKDDDLTVFPGLDFFPVGIGSLRNFELYIAPPPEEGFTNSIRYVRVFSNSSTRSLVENVEWIVNGRTSLLRHNDGQGTTGPDIRLQDFNEFQTNVDIDNFFTNDYVRILRTDFPITATASHIDIGQAGNWQQGFTRTINHEIRARAQNFIRVSNATAQEGQQAWLRLDPEGSGFHKLTGLTAAPVFLATNTPFFEESLPPNWILHGSFQHADTFAISGNASRLLIFTHGGDDQVTLGSVDNDLEQLGAIAGRIRSQYSVNVIGSLGEDRLFIRDNQYQSSGDATVVEGFNVQGPWVFSNNTERSFFGAWHSGCLLYTSPSPRDQRGSRMPSSA